MSTSQHRGGRRSLDIALALALLAGGGLTVADARPGPLPLAVPAVTQNVRSGDTFTAVGAESGSSLSGRSGPGRSPVVGERPAASDDGRFVAFTSVLGNLVPGDSNFSDDVFVFDRTTSAVEVVSVGAGGAPMGGVLTTPAISGDGRYVVFTSTASSGLPGDDSEGIPDVFRRDRQTGTTTRVSRPVDGAGLDSPAGALSSTGAISDDGRWVVYESAATNLVVGDSNSVSDVFVRDMGSSSNTRVSVATSGQPNGDSVLPVISGDGTTVVFQSYASNIVVGDSNGQTDPARNATADVFVRSRTGGATQRASVRTNGTQTAIGSHSANPSVSHDGTRIAFESDDPALAPGADSNAGPDIFVRDRTASTTKRVSTTSGLAAAGNAPAFAPVISGDGTHVVYHSAASNVHGNLDVTGGRVLVFRASASAASAPRVVSRVDGANATSTLRAHYSNGSNGPSALTHDGSRVVFVSEASNLDPDGEGRPTDTNQAIDIFVRDTTADTTSILPIMGQDPQGSLVRDGSFERPAFDAGGEGGVTDGWEVYDVSSGRTYGAWTLVDGGFDVVGPRVGNAGDGMQYLDLNGGNNPNADAYNSPEPRTKISQRVATKVNRRYRMTALIAGNPVQEPIVKEMRIQFGPLTRDTSFDVTGNSNANLRWEEVGLELDACSTETEVIISTRTVGVRGPLLDKVRVVEVGPAQVPCCVQPGPFRDVEASHPFCEDITWLVLRGVTTGYGDGGYHPDAPVTRQAMAAFLSRADSREPRPACTEAPFPDVPRTHRYCREIAWMKWSGIAGGYADGTFKPLAPITRQAMSAFLQRAYGPGRAEDCLSGPFGDIPATHQFCREVRWMIRSAITGGYGDGNFHPEASVSRQAMAAFLRRATST